MLQSRLARTSSGRTPTKTMSDKLRPIQAAENAVESATQSAKGKLLDWLPHYNCDNCGAICEAKTEFVTRQATHLPVWKCPECGKRYHQDEDNPLSFEMWDRK